MHVPDPPSCCVLRNRNRRERTWSLGEAIVLCGVAIQCWRCNREASLTRSFSASGCALPKLPWNRVRRSIDSQRFVGRVSTLVNKKQFRTTVTGSYPRPVQPGNTMKKPSLSRAERDDMIRWAVKDQSEAGLDTVTDGEGCRENMYYFFQKRLDGLSMRSEERR